MSTCGGGVSVRINSDPKVVKLLKVDEILSVLNIQEKIVTVA